VNVLFESTKDSLKPAEVLGAIANFVQSGDVNYEEFIKILNKAGAVY